MFSSFRKIFGILFIILMIISIPISLILIKQQQDIRQRASGGLSAVCWDNGQCASGMKCSWRNDGDPDDGSGRCRYLNGYGDGSHKCCGSDSDCGSSSMYCPDGNNATQCDSRHECAIRPEQPKQNLGGSCAQQSDCNANLTCSSGICKANTGTYSKGYLCCVADITNCGAGNYCSSSDPTDLCLSNRVCKPNPTNLGLGQSCTDNNQCASGLKCSSGPSGGISTCRYLDGYGGPPKCCRSDSNCGESSQRCPWGESDAPSDSNCDSGTHCIARPTETSPTTPVNPTSPQPTTAPGSTVLIYNLHLPGIGKGNGENSNPSQSLKNFMACVYALNVDPTGDLNCDKAVIKTKSGAEVIQYDPTSGDFKNRINMGSIATGQYQILVKADGYLRKKVSQALSITSGNDIVVPTATLVPGDTNGDNKLDLTDFNMLISCYGSKQCSQKTQADLNNNGNVDTVDLNIFLRNLTTQSGD